VRWDGGSTIRQKAGALSVVSGVTSDIPALKRAEERQSSLGGPEIDHRAKNTVALVQSNCLVDAAQEVQSLYAGRWKGVSMLGPGFIHSRHYELGMARPK